MKSPDGTNALTFLLRIWVDNQLRKRKILFFFFFFFFSSVSLSRLSFYGSYQTKVTLFALVLLFKLNSPQLNSIKVKGVEIVPTGRSTRSKGPIRYSEIPLQQKIFEVCVAAFVDTVRDAAEINDEEEMDEFSSEDDDFLDEEEYGEKKISVVCLCLFVFVYVCLSLFIFVLFCFVFVLFCLFFILKQKFSSFDHGTPLDALLRMANDEEADMGDRDDPEFKDDPVRKGEKSVGLFKTFFSRLDNVTCFLI